MIDKEKLIDNFVKDLFTTGHTGEEVDRLVLTTKSGRDIGGWGRAAIKARLVSLVEELGDEQV